MIDLYDPNLSESEIQQKLAKDVAQRWKAETKEGREFEKFFASRPENIDTLAKVFDLLDEHLSWSASKPKSVGLSGNRIANLGLTHTQPAKSLSGQRLTEHSEAI